MMTKILEALVVLLLCVPVYGEDIILDANTPNEVLAVQVLIEKFDSLDIVIRTKPRGMIPAFVIYAEAAAFFGDCAVDPLIKALGEESQIRVAAAIGLEAIGPAAIKATPQLIVMLAGSDRDNILACGIIRGIGPDAVKLVPLLRPLLDNDNFHVQYWACRALNSIGPGAQMATPDLCRELLMGIASVRRNAAITLGNIAPGMTKRQLQETIDALEVATQDKCQPVRVAATEALDKISVFNVSCKEVK